MLLARYFLYVGGALLALLLIVSAELPQAPVASDTNSAADLPAIRINSDHKWPAKVVFDTNAPAVASTLLAGNIPDAKAPPHAEVAPKSAPREALAQLAPSDVKKSSARKSEKSEPKLRQRHKVVVANRPAVPSRGSVSNRVVVANRFMPRRRMYPPPMMVAQQPQYGFGFFGSRIW